MGRDVRFPATGNEISQEARNRKLGVRKVIIIYAITALSLLIPFAFIALSLDEMIGYGWPGPWHNDMAALNGQESELGLELGILLSIIGLITAGVAAGGAAKRHGVSWIRAVAAGTAALLAGFSLLLFLMLA